MTTKTPNRLIHQQSPYLLQHAYNPVDWYPWSEEAFAKAKEEDKPVFLSIGYSTCHWCHVMEKESFEDPEVAGKMNEAFINIKVDREERPDIDGIYMAVCQAMTGAGGWPLTIVMTHEKKPFFAGTYFPKESKYKRIGMMDLITRIQDVWQNNRTDVLNSAEELTNAFKKEDTAPRPVFYDADILHSAFNTFRTKFDKEFAGFGNAPKFPTPHNLIFLCRYANHFDEPEAADMAEHSVRAMLMGGIYDHLGGGLHRYSTDKKWLLPHFEKMLYDQAMLVLAITELYQLTGNKEYTGAILDILRYVSRDLTSPEGAFLSAEDADSEGEEGKFYLWSREEILHLLKDDGPLFCDIFQIKEEGNFYDPFKGGFTGENIIHRIKDITGAAAENNLSADDLNSKIESWFSLLLKHRSERIRPHLDDKILTDWNGLMIAAYARAGFVLNDQNLIAKAESAAAFILSKMMKEDATLMHRYRDGEVSFDGTLDDYAFMIYALIELHQAAGKSEYLRTALSLCDSTVRHFFDTTHGAFYFTADFAEKLIIRQKEIYDGAIPSGNSVMLMNLLRLFALTGNTKYEVTAKSVIDYFAHTVQQYPAGYTMFLSASFGHLFGMTETVIADSGKDSLREDTLQLIRDSYLPDEVHIIKRQGEDISDIAPFTSGMSPAEEGSLVYICKDFSCKLPTNSTAEIRMLLE
ncbi:MAG: thioredoxin domain-containing protein [Ignavibacteriales bacterium]|nr:MAG: thioredoxin domain-containing protein [Ignavibacteriales bacterium]